LFLALNLWVFERRLLAMDTSETIVSWEYVFGSLGVEAEKLNEIRIKKEVIPIIFIPGFSGTRLKNSEELIWDPDNLTNFLPRFGLIKFNGSSVRKGLLIGDGTYRGEYLQVAHKARFYKSENQGWDNLIQGFYGDLRNYQLQRNIADVLSLCFETPFYAFGYNWTDSPDVSGRLLAASIKGAIAHHGVSDMCRRVILLTHSMGGLVARSASKSHGAESSILGIIHTVQPASGAPAAYSRMKEGYKAKLKGNIDIFDRIEAWLLGRSGREMTATLGNMPGALSLLPNHLYQGADNDPAWLHMQASGDGLPRLDPYAEIYRNRTHAWRLIDEALLNPGSGNVELDWRNYLISLESVERFHRNLGAYQHPNSFHIVGDNMYTVTTCNYKAWTSHRRIMFSKPAEKVAIEKFEDERLAGLLAVHETGGFWARSKLEDENQIRIKLSTSVPPDGDGTVPVSSAKSLSHDDSDVAIIPFLEHGKAMKNINVLKKIGERIDQILYNVIYKEARLGDIESE
jgi:pimeloyl-ACP methyl ester carboxylesterase